MNIPHHWRLFRLALGSLRENLPRHFLALLGIIVGVAAVISLSAVGQVGEARLLHSVAMMGGTTITVTPAAITPTAGRPAIRGRYRTLTMDDLEAIRRHLPGIAAVAPVNQASFTARHRGLAATVNVIGSTNELLRIEQRRLAGGRLFTADEQRRGLPVALIGQTAADNLFPGSSRPLGQRIQLGSQFVTIVGILTAAGVSAGGRDEDDAVIVPINLYRRRFTEQNYLEEIKILPAASGRLPAVKEAVTRLLAARHRPLPDGKKDFTVQAMTDYLRRKTRMGRLINRTTTAVAAIALLIGGIGIMAVLLVKIREKMREIGVKRAVGATRMDIFWEFFWESCCLALGGGLIGLLAGALLAGYIIAASGYGLPFPLAAAGGAFAAAVVIGILAGLYPAWKAAFLTPIEALAEE
ncbi:MAG: ABC transporter permease [Deltaproteobacteria bacterium]|nr:ABC transporter permease [Deltaproteobacteria bacterium]